MGHQFSLSSELGPIFSSAGRDSSFRQVFDDQGQDVNLETFENRDIGFKPLKNVFSKQSEPLETALDYFSLPELEMEDVDGADGPLSFLQAESGEPTKMILSHSLTAFLNPEQLNVAVGVSDRPYAHTRHMHTHTVIRQYSVWRELTLSRSIRADTQW